MDALAPIAANYRLTKQRLALLASMGLGILIMLSWAFEAALKWAVGWRLNIELGGWASAPLPKPPRPPPSDRLQRLAFGVKN